MESKKSGGALSASLLTLIESAKKDNVPKDVIERAIKKGKENTGASLEQITYEAYGPGGSALIIEALTQNRNKAAQEVKHILSKHGLEIATPGSATWAFQKKEGEWVPNMTLPLSDEDTLLLQKIVDELEENDEVSDVFTNVE